MKRILLIVALLLVLLGAILYLGSKVRGTAALGRGTMHALPEDPIALLRINSWATFAHALSASQGLLARTLNHDQYRWLPLFAHRVDSTLRTTSQWSLSNAYGDSFLAFYTEGKDDVAWIVALPLGEARLSVGKWLGILFEDATSTRQYDYEHITIVECHIHDGKANRTTYAAIHHGVALWSSSHILLQRALRRTEQMPSIMREEGFRRVYESSDRRRVTNLYLRPHAAIPLLARGMRHELRSSLLALRQWAPWIALDIDDAPAQLNLLGESRFSDSIPCVGDSWRGAKPTSLHVNAILPSTTALFMRWGAPDGQGLMQLFHSASVAMRSQPLLDLFVRACSGEMTLARILGTASMEPFWAVFMECESPSESLRLLDGYSNIGAAHSVRPFRTPKAFNQLFGAMFPPQVGAYYIALDGYIAFSNSEANLRYIQNTAQRQQNLLRSQNWEVIQANVQSRCTFMFYADMHSAARWSKPLLDPPSPKHGLVGQLMANSGQIALQISGASNNLFYSAALQTPSHPATSRAAAWEVGLKAPLYARPQLVKSHRAKANLMLAQDNQGGLYLIDGNGTTLWYRLIGENILGEAIAVDALRNGKLQYAFATPSKIWVVDYEGNNLPGFPYTLPSAAAAPLAVFDYAKNHDYRFVVPCANRQIVLIDAKGKRRADFQPQRMEAAPNGPAYLYQHASKDYIVTTDNNRLYILNRRGQERTPISEPLRKHAESPIVYLGEGRIALLDTQGRICTLSLVDGTVRATAPLQGWNGHGTVLFDAHARGEEPFCLLAHADQLSAHTAKGKRIFLYEAPGELIPWLQTFDFGSMGKLWGVCVPASAKALLIDGRGKPRAEFKASTPFSIGRLDANGTSLKLVAGDRASVVVYQAAIE